MRRRSFIKAAGAALFVAAAPAILRRPAMAQSQSDWCFRVTDLTTFVSDMNGFAAANSRAPLLPASWDPSQSDQFPDSVREDFDAFYIYWPGPTALSPPVAVLHVNMRMTALAGADLAAFTSQVQAWYGVGGTGPACPTLASLTNAKASPNAILQTVGQVWPTTGKTALINPMPTLRKRVWA